MLNGTTKPFATIFIAAFKAMLRISYEIFQSLLYYPKPSGKYLVVTITFFNFVKRNKQLPSCHPFSTLNLWYNPKWLRNILQHHHPMILCRWKVTELELRHSLRPNDTIDEPMCYVYTSYGASTHLIRFCSIKNNLWRVYSNNPTSGSQQSENDGVQLE